jgi:uncharacterized protein (DUF302 family)
VKWSAGAFLFLVFVLSRPEGRWMKPAPHSGIAPPIVAASVGLREGIVDIPSTQSVDQTVAKLENLLQSKGVTLFAVVDHSGEAAKAGLVMPPTKLLIFGNPTAGTPLMLAAPTIALDLPLKILVWQDGAGKVWCSYNSPAYLALRHGLAANLQHGLAAVEPLAKAACAAGITP